MKILELRAENIKNLKAVEIKADSTANVLTGENGAGKSSILDSIFMALTGKKLERPIRNGEKRGEILVDLGTYKIKRVYTDKGDRLEVMSADGATFKSPQTLLDSLLGELSFDPLEFSKMKPGAQRDLLAEMIGLNLEKFNKEKQAKYDERTAKNKEVNSLQSILSSMPEPAKDLPEQEISIEDKVNELDALEKKKSAYAEYIDAKEDCEQSNRDLDEEIAEAQEEIKELMASIKSKELLKERNNETFKKLNETTPEEIIEETLNSARAAITEAEKTNEDIRAANARRDTAKKLESAKKEAEDLSAQIEKIEQQKKEQVTQAKYPLAGLSLNDESVVYLEKPFSQLSTGEQIRVSTAIAIKLNPRLKIILIREGSLLDKKGLAEIISIAKDNDYQLWIEKVGDDKKVGIFIENGEIIK
jgi:recombinational DNA repair ATPase RecF